MSIWPADLNDPEASSVELGVLVAYLDEIVHAVDARDRERIPDLLAEPMATHLPREVREELVLFVRQGAGSFRAPIKFLRFRYRTLQLRAGEESTVAPQLDLGLGQGSGWPAAPDVDPNEDDSSLRPE